MAEAKLAPSLPQWMVDHANRYISSGGKEGHIYTVTPPGYSEMHVPSLLLTTTGRKSGEKYIFPLFYGEDGKNYIIVASKGGAPQHPNWYRNLVANPEVEVQVGTRKLRAKARTATGAERDKLWEKALKFWPPYADYAKKTERQIPVVAVGTCRIDVNGAAAPIDWRATGEQGKTNRRARKGTFGCYVASKSIS